MAKKAKDSKKEQIKMPHAEKPTSNPVANGSEPSSQFISVSVIAY